MALVADRPSQTWKAALVLTVVVGAVTTVVAYLGSAPQATTPQPPPPADKAAGAFPVVQSIVLPHDDPDPPPGPHREKFRVACTVCHSTRLVLGQPRLPRDKWGEVVQKMVKVYGAPIPPSDESDIVEYLTAAHGP
jgi:hypothetical protein